MKLTKKEKVKKEIIQYAKKVVMESGFEKLTVRGLAKETGFSFTNIYYYFENLDTLFWDLRLEMIEDMIKELTFISSSEENSINELINVLSDYVSYYFKRPNIFRFFYFKNFVKPTEDNSFDKIEVKFSEMWQTLFSRLIQEGIVSYENIEIMSKTIIYSLHGMIMLSFSSNGSMNQEDINNELKKIVRNLLK